MLLFYDQFVIVDNNSSNEKIGVKSIRFYRWCSMLYDWIGDALCYDQNDLSNQNDARWAEPNWNRHSDLGRSWSNTV